MVDKSGFSADLATTAMRTMPHDDIDEVLKIAFTVDVPFRSLLPGISFYEDMHIRAVDPSPYRSVYGRAKSPVSLTLRITAEKGTPPQALLAPAACNLLTPDKKATVEKAFRLLNDLSPHPKER